MIKRLIGKLVRKLVYIDEPETLCISLAKNRVELKMCEHLGMWRLVTPQVQGTGLIVHGGLAGFSGVFDHAVREAALALDAEVQEALTDLNKVVEDEDDPHLTLTEPVIDGSTMTKDIEL